jgi:hypothetical protein
MDPSHRWNAASAMMETHQQKYVDSLGWRFLVDFSAMTVDYRSCPFQIANLVDMYAEWTSSLEDAVPGFAGGPEELQRVASMAQSLRYMPWARHAPTQELQDFRCTSYVRIFVPR